MRLLLGTAHAIIAKIAIYVFACLDNVYDTQPAYPQSTSSHGTFLARNVSLLTLSGDNRDRRSLTLQPALLNKRSNATLPSLHTYGDTCAIYAYKDGVYA